MFSEIHSDSAADQATAEVSMLHQRISELEKENTRLLLDLDTARHSANVMEKDRDKAEDERDAWKECAENLAAPLRVFAPHCTYGNAPTEAIAAFDKLRGERK